MGFDWNFVIEIMPELLRGLKTTFNAAIISFAFAAIVGLLLALARRSSIKWLAKSMDGFVEFIRSTPLLVQLYFFFYVLPLYGIKLPGFLVGVIGLGLHYSAYLSEVYRAGINAIDRGQWEAARALNFSARRTWIGIILPQAIPPMIPALGNYLVAMFKETPQLAAITVLEMLQRAKNIGAATFRFLEPITMVGLLFFLISYPAALLVQRLEARYAKANR
jgi:polar amino acid transport system permease protein